jgi:hypothetical protein
MSGAAGEVPPPAQLHLPDGAAAVIAGSCLDLVALSETEDKRFAVDYLAFLCSYPSPAVHKSCLDALVELTSVRSLVWAVALTENNHLKKAVDLCILIVLEKHEGPRTRALELLCNLAASAEARKMIVASGVLPALFKVCAEATEETLLQLASQTLVHLTDTEKITDPQALPMAITLSKSNFNTVIASGLLMVANLAAIEANVQIILDDGFLCDAISVCLDSDEPFVIGGATRVLAKLARHSYFDQEYESGNLKEAVTRLCSMDNVHVRKQLCLLLSELARKTRNPKICAAFIEGAGYLDLLVECCSTSTNDEVLVNSTAAIRMLSVDKEMMKTLTTLDLVQPLLRLSGSHIDQAGLVQNVTACLSALISADKSALDAAAVLPIVQLSRRALLGKPPDTGTCLNASKLLCILSEDKDSKDVMIQSNTVHIALKFLTSSSVVLRRNAAALLTNLAAEEEATDSFMAESCGPLIAALQGLGTTPRPAVAAGGGAVTGVSAPKVEQPDSKILRYILKTIAQLGAREKSRGYLLPTIKPIVQLYNTNTDINVIRSSTEALSHLGHSCSRWHTEARIGIVKLVVRLCKMGVDEDEKKGVIHFHATQMVGNMAAFENVATELLMNGVTAALVVLCNKSPHNSIVRSASTAIGKLAQHKTSVPLIIRQKGIEPLIQYLAKGAKETPKGRTAEKAAVLAAVVQSLVQFSKVDAGRYQLIKSGAIKHIVMLCATRHGVAVNTCATMAISNMAEHGGARAKIIDAGAIPALFENLGHSDDSITIYACDGLRHLSANPAGVEALLKEASANRMDVLKDLCTSVNVDIVEHATALILTLSNNPEIRKKVVSQDLVEKLIALCSKSFATPGMQEKVALGALTALNSLMNNSVTRTQLGTEEIVTALIGECKRRVDSNDVEPAESDGSNDKDLKKIALKLLRSLSQEQKWRPLLAEQVAKTLYGICLDAPPTCMSADELEIAELEAKEHKVRLAAERARNGQPEEEEEDEEGEYEDEEGEDEEEEEAESSGTLGALTGMLGFAAGAVIGRKKAPVKSKEQIQVEKRKKEEMWKKMMSKAEKKKGPGFDAVFSGDSPEGSTRRLMGAKDCEEEADKGGRKEAKKLVKYAAQTLATIAQHLETQVDISVMLLELCKLSRNEYVLTNATTALAALTVHDVVVTKLLDNSTTLQESLSILITLMKEVREGTVLFGVIKTAANLAKNTAGRSQFFEEDLEVTQTLLTLCEKAGQGIMPGAMAALKASAEAIALFASAEEMKIVLIKWKGVQVLCEACRVAIKDKTPESCTSTDHQICLLENLTIAIDEVAGNRQMQPLQQIAEKGFNALLLVLENSSNVSALRNCSSIVAAVVSNAPLRQALIGDKTAWSLLLTCKNIQDIRSVANTAGALSYIALDSSGRLGIISNGGVKILTRAVSNLSVSSESKESNSSDTELLQCNVARTFRNLLFSYCTETPLPTAPESSEENKGDAPPPKDPRKEKETYIQRLVTVGIVPALLWLCEHCEEDNALADATATLAELCTSRSAPKLVQQVGE